MPLNYQSSFGRAGATAGGGLFGSLGRLMEPLDWARQAAWNVPGKIADGDWAAAAPGLLGAGLGGALALTGVGAPLAIGLGAVLGGGLQGAGKHYDEERFDAPSGSTLMQALGVDPESLPGMAGGMALNALGDPLTYGGGALFKGLGSRYGRYAEDVARSKGPLYGGGSEPFAQAHTAAEEIARKYGINSGPFSEPSIPLRGPDEARSVADRLSELMRSPHFPALMNELPPGSEFAGHGREGFWFTAPGSPGGVRIAGGPRALDVREGLGAELGINQATNAPLPRVQSDLMLQPVRDVVHGPYRVEHLPSIDMMSLDAQMGGRPLNPLDAEMQHAIGHLDTEFRPGPVPHGLTEAAKQRGMATLDLGPTNMEGERYVNPGNMGRTKEGNYIISDAGSLVSPNKADYPVRTPQVAGDPITNAILKMMGSGKGMQREIAEKLAQGTAGQGLPLDQLRGMAAQGKVAEGGADMARLIENMPPTNTPMPRNKLELAAWEEALRLNRNSAFAGMEGMPAPGQVAAIRRQMGIPEPSPGLSHPPTAPSPGGLPVHHVPPAIDPVTGQPLVNLMQGLDDAELHAMFPWFKQFGEGTLRNRLSPLHDPQLAGLRFNGLPYPLSGPG